MVSAQNSEAIPNTGTQKVSSNGAALEGMQFCKTAAKHVVIVLEPKLGGCAKTWLLGGVKQFLSNQIRMFGGIVFGGMPLILICLSPGATRKRLRERSHVLAGLLLDVHSGNRLEAA